VVPADRVAPVGPVSRADRAMDMAATGREVTSPVVPEGTSPAAPEDTGPAAPAARVDLEDRGTLVGLGDRAVRASPVVLAGTIPADPAVTILADRGRMVQVPRAQGLRGRAVQVLNPGRALLDLTPTVPDRAHLDRTPAVPDLMPGHPDRRRRLADLMRPADRRWVATAQVAAVHPAAPIRPVGRTPRLAATPPEGATHPVEVTDLRP
jgi:hypothetical protein